mgnify:CR=1 FL=1
MRAQTNQNDYVARLVQGIAVLQAISTILYVIVELSQTNQHRIGPIWLMYPGPEHAYGVIRMLAMLGVGAATMAGAFLWPGSTRVAGWLGAAGALGAGVIASALSVLVLYQYACCDSPVFVLAGFPSSWLHIMTIVPQDPSLSIPSVLSEGLSRSSWYIDSGSFAVTVLFWVNTMMGGVMLASVVRRVGRQTLSASTKS